MGRLVVMGRAAFAVLVIGLCGVGGVTGQEAPGVATPKVLVIGIDGIRPDVLAEVPTPHLDAMAREGRLIDDARTTTPSVSGPSWSSMLTGVWPDKHGVIDNEFTGQRYATYPDFLTRVEQVDASRSTVVVADWTPLVRSDGPAPTISDAVDRKHVLDGYELGWPEADRHVADVAVEVLTTADPDAMFVYLGNPDETSHQHESIGNEYREAIATADQQVGAMVAAIRSRASFAEEDWLVIASTDHGRRPDGGHGGESPEEMTIFVLLHGVDADAGARGRRAFVVDVAVTALDHLGIEARPEWGLDGRSLLR